MRLTGLAWQGYALPFRTPFATSSGTARARFGLLVWLRSEDGLTGVGEASPVGAGSESEVRALAAGLGEMIPRLKEPDLEAELPDVPASLRFGIETAILDLRAKRAGQPLVELLGGHPATLPLNATIASEQPSEAAAEAAAAVAEGFTCLKLKVGHTSLREDMNLVAATRGAVGPGVAIRIDPNQAWDVEEAIETIRALAQYDIEYVEQPVLARDVDGLAKVRRSVSVPIAADESLASLDDLRRLINADAADLFILKPARLGGIDKTLEVAHLALDARKPVVVTSSLECGIGVAACAHLAAALPSQPLSHGLATGLLFREDLTSPRLLPKRGLLSIPEAPGLGLDVDVALVAKYGLEIKGSADSWQGS